MNLDWELFKIQKEYLVRLIDDPRCPIEELDMLDGIINLMDHIQDTFKPLNVDENKTK